MGAEELLVKDLREAIAARQVVAVVGAGVSVAASGRAPVASWTGLLRDGVDRCRALYPSLPQRWAERCFEEIESTDLDDLLSAAEKISRRLGAPGGGEFARWLRETVGVLCVQDRSVVDALAALGVPIVTTNYDGLLEEASHRPAVTWRQSARVERVPEAVNDFETDRRGVY